MRPFRYPATAPHLLTTVRAWFGLGQTELAQYLGVSQALVPAVEAWRCRLGPAGQVALLPLLRQLPPLPPPPLPPPNLPEPLRRRHRDLRLLTLSLAERLAR